MKLTKELVTKLRDAINVKMEGLQSEFPSLEIRAGNCTFSPSSATFKLEVRNTGLDGDLNSDEAEYNRRAMSRGWPAFGAVFKSGDETYTVCGCKPSNRVYPIIVHDTSGKRFKMSSRMVLDAIAQSLT